MRLSKDKAEIINNDFLTLAGIPAEVYEYRLGNRRALDGIIDQYQVSTDKRSGIVNDPNNPDDPEYIVKLVGKVITVSLETVKIVGYLPELEAACARNRLPAVAVIPGASGRVFHNAEALKTIFFSCFYSSK